MNLQDSMYKLFHENREKDMHIDVDDATTEAIMAIYK